MFQLKDKCAYAYTPLVPDDEHDLYERVTALKQWANGFMTGFGINCRLSAEKQFGEIGAIRLAEVG